MVPALPDDVLSEDSMHFSSDDEAQVILPSPILSEPEEPGEDPHPEGRGEDSADEDDMPVQLHKQRKFTVYPGPSRQEVFEQLEFS